MNLSYFNIYNNLVKLTRNKSLYENFTEKDTFSDRLVIFLIHFAFFLKIYKSKNDKKLMQEIYDYFFRQIELSIREIGYGDVTINKKMKDYINIFHSILNKVEKWDTLNQQSKLDFLKSYLNTAKNPLFFVNYFEKFEDFLSNNTLNYFTNDIIDPKI